MAADVIARSGLSTDLDLASTATQVTLVMRPESDQALPDGQCAAARSSIADSQARCAARFSALGRSGWWIGRVSQVISKGVASGGRLFGISDVHVGNPENWEVVESLRAESDNDWLIVAGDVAELISDIEWALRVVRDRFHTVIWVPGNHEVSIQVTR
jgi:hypothetical protein